MLTSDGSFGNGFTKRRNLVSHIPQLLRPYRGTFFLTALFTLLCGTDSSVLADSAIDSFSIRKSENIDEVVFSFRSEEGYYYDLWQEPLSDGPRLKIATEIIGDGAVKSLSRQIAGNAPQFFRLQRLDLAPVAIPNMLIGGNLPGNPRIKLATETRFELAPIFAGNPTTTGNWGYQKTGHNTGVLKFTFDTLENDPNERYEILWTFSSLTKGQTRFSSYGAGIENPNSVFISEFDFNNIPVLPPPPTSLVPEVYPPSLLGESLPGFPDYHLDSANRFTFRLNGTGPPLSGNWVYSVSAVNRALLIFTYDRDGNNASIYQEVKSFTFETTTKGTTLFATYVNNVRVGNPEIGTFDFNLSSPTASEFSSCVVGHFLFQVYRITSATRFSYFNETGNWKYTKTGTTRGVVVFTYDEDNNNPNVFRDEVILTFTSPNSGTERHSEIERGVEKPETVGTSSFFLPCF